MSFALIVSLALLVTIGYFLVLLSGEIIAWVVNQLARIVEERRFQSPAHST